MQKSNKFSAKFSKKLFFYLHVFIQHIIFHIQLNVFNATYECLRLTKNKNAKIEMHFPKGRRLLGHLLYRETKVI